MPKYHPNNRFSDCYASVGNITFYHRDGECYYRAKANPIFPETPGQQEQLSLHRRAIKAWRELSHDTQLQLLNSWGFSCGEDVVLHSSRIISRKVPTVSIAIGVESS